MNLPSEGQGEAAESAVLPLEFRLVAAEVDGAASEEVVSGGREQGMREAAERSEAARLQGVTQGLQEGIRRARAEMEAEMLAGVARERERLLGVVEAFAEARERYFGDVEQEVVRLALAIAARVLHREAQVDGLLLAGAARVALERLADKSGVVLRAAEGDVAAWERMFADAGAAERPEVLGDAGLGRGECVLETKMGTVELGVNEQLVEIERGFFDLLQHRPAR